MKKILSLLTLMVLSIVGANAKDYEIKYALSEGDTFTSGQSVDVKNGDEVVATIVYGESGGNAFKAAIANTSVTGYTAFTEGNDTNGNKTGGTFYTITPKYAGTISVAVALNADKAFYVIEDGTALADYNGIKESEKVYKAYSFDVKAGSSYKVYCSGSKLGFYGFTYTYSVEEAKTIYLKPGVWNADGARYAAYVFVDDATNEWIDFAAAEEEGVYTATIPVGYTGLILARMNGTTPENNWDNKWNQTDNITLADIASNTLFTITDWGSGNSPYSASAYLYITKMTAVGDFISNWEIASGWDMTKSTEDANVWSVTKENVTLNVGTYELKAVANGAWELCDIPAENYQLNITAKGIYTVTVTVNTSDRSMNVVATKTANVPIESMTVVGTFLGLEGDANWAFKNGWSLKKEEATEGHESTIWTLTKEDVELKLGKYEYKIVANNDWNDVVLPAGDNKTFELTEDGHYTLVFTADLSTNEITCEATKTGDTPAVYEYGVVGKGGLFTTEWDEENALKMNLVDANYTWTSAKNTYLDAQTIEFKVIKKAVNVTEATKWYPEGTGNNQTIEISEAGYYTITVNFNSETGEITSNVEQREKPVFAANSIYSWESPDGVQDQKGGTATPEADVNIANDKYYTIRLSGKNDFSTNTVVITLDNALKAGDEIAITAYRNKNDANKGSGAKLKFNDAANTTLNIGDGLAFNNISTAEAVASEYGDPNTITAEVPDAADGSTTITMTRSTTSTNLFITKIEIIRKAVDAEITSTTGWATFSSNMPVDLSSVTGLTAYTVTGVSGETVEISPVSGIVPANTGLLLNGAADTYSIPTTSEAGAALGTNLLKAATGEVVGAIDGYTRYVLSEDEGKAVFQCIWNDKEGTDVRPTIPVGKAYLEVPISSGARNILTIGSETTGINNVEHAGQFTFGTVYNMAGQRVSQPTRGLYIMNGKKVVVK